MFRTAVPNHCFRNHKCKFAFSIFSLIKVAYARVLRPGVNKTIIGHLHNRRWVCYSDHCLNKRPKAPYNSLLFRSCWNNNGPLNNQNGSDHLNTWLVYLLFSFPMHLFFQDILSFIFNLIVKTNLELLFTCIAAIRSLIWFCIWMFRSSVTC